MDVVSAHGMLPDLVFIQLVHAKQNKDVYRKKRYKIIITNIKRTGSVFVLFNSFLEVFPCNKVCKGIELCYS